MTFQNGTDKYFARQQAFNRIGDVTLPSGVTPSLAPLSSPSGLIYRYVLQSSDRSPMELKTFEDWVIEPQFRSVPGGRCFAIHSGDRKSTRLNSSHQIISYAVFCLKKKTI